MDGIGRFVDAIKNIGWSEKANEKLIRARSIVREINRFLFVKNDSLGTLEVLGKELPFFSEFHMFWMLYHKDILGLTVDDSACGRVADVLHDVCVKTHGRAFGELYSTESLPPDVVCRIRLLTANQDFRGSRNFNELAGVYSSDPSVFDLDCIIDSPESFLKDIAVTGLSQNDKRSKYARTFAQFVKDHGGSPIGLIDWFNSDIAALRKAMIECVGAGYGNKKTDMVLRDMVVHGIWTNVKGFDSIDVASDINTIGVALRTGILHSEIPLVSSFLDIFCYQYEYVDKMNAAAWRRVWEIWHERHAEDAIDSPCLLDYFIYKVVGKQFCRATLAVFACENGHIFPWHSSRNRKCQVCYKNGDKHVRAKVIAKVLPCEHADGAIAIVNTEYVKSGAAPAKMNMCPFKSICDSNGQKHLQPPKSISIMGQTGWETAYADEDCGGGGLMA